MDLDDFDAAIAKLHLNDEEELVAPPGQGLSAQKAVQYIDTEWYSLVNRRARWMDLIGDYAGSERFILDGTSTRRRG